MSDLDPAEIMAAHKALDFFLGDVRCDQGCGTWPCEPYQLAEALAAERAKVARVELLCEAWLRWDNYGLAVMLRVALADQPERVQP